MASHRPVISLTSLTLPALAPSLLVNVAADTGFDAVGINLLQVWRTVSGDQRWFSAEVDNVAGVLAERGLQLNHGGHVLLGALDRQVASHVLAAMRQLQAQQLVLVAAPQASLSSIEDDLAFVRSHWDDTSMLVEFAPYTGWRGLADAMRFIESHPAISLQLVIDVLHLVRSDSLALLLSGRDWPVGLIQVCDAPLQPPQRDALQMEARGNRLDVGEGALPLTDIFTRLPKHVPIEVEAPCLALRNLTPQVRAQRSYSHLIAFLKSQGYAVRESWS